MLLFFLFVVETVVSDLVSFEYNPVLRATSPPGSQYQCEENIYSQEIFELDGGWFVMLYGGWDGSYDCHDRIYLAVSRDLLQWRKYPSDSNPVAVLDHGESNHVNDPSILYLNNTFFMFYTDAGVSQDDRVWLATSKTLTNFQKVREIIGPGAKDSWNELKVGRPVIHVDPSTKYWYLWYDGSNLKQVRCVGLSISKDGGESFHPVPENPLYCGGGGIDVKYIKDLETFVLVEEGGDGIHQRTSKDGISWSSSKLFLKSNSGSYDKYGTVVPSIFVFNNSLQYWFGGAQQIQWDRNNIAFGYNPSEIHLEQLGGCTGCTGRSGGLSCSSACGFRKSGKCANPGSVDPSRCCVCWDDPCSNCLPSGVSDCHTACTGMQYPGGYCAHPGSTIPEICCSCIEL